MEYFAWNIKMTSSLETLMYFCLTRPQRLLAPTTTKSWLCRFLH